MASGDDRLLAVLDCYRLAFHEENPNLSTSERNKIFQERWNRINSYMMCNSTPASPSDSLVPQKRSAPVMQLFGLERTPKRAVPASHTVSAPQLERHTSAPGSHPTRMSKITLVSGTASHSHPISIPGQGRLSGRRASTSNASNPDKPFKPGTLNDIDELHDWSPTDYLARALDQNVQPALTFSFTGPKPEHGEWHAPDMSMLSTAPLAHEGTHSPVATTSDSGLTTASTALSEPMTRCNTNDQVCEPLAMFHMDTALGNYSGESTDVMPKVTYPSSLSVFPSSSLSQFPFSDKITEYPSVPISSMMMMKTTRSEESVSSSSSESISFDFPMFSTDGHPSQAKPRTLAPKKQDAASQQPPVPKLVAIKGEDGTIKHKAEITRAIRQPPQRKSTFCDFCNDKPQGFHSDHELQRHTGRQHTQYRKVWICQDISEDGTFLRNCKACRNNKTYGANYNAAAHLRRTHFNPCKNKRGGRGKKSEGRGGMGGGNSPSMEELKKWMYETYEFNYNGRLIVQNIAPDSNMPSIPMPDLTDFDQNTTMSDHFDFELDAPLVNDTQSFENSYSNEYKHISGNSPYQQLHPYHYHG